MARNVSIHDFLRDGELRCQFLLFPTVDLRLGCGVMHFSFAALCILVFTLSAEAQEWTRFRGPNGSGAGKADLPEQITDKNILWRATLPGSGHSSPVVWGEKIFLTCSPSGVTDAEARRIVVCIGAKDGKLLWQREYSTGAYRKHADNSFASPSCAVDAERVYFWAAGPEKSILVALAQADGKEIWQRELGPFQSQHGPGSSPFVLDDAVVLDSDQDGPGSFVQAFDAKSGATRWKAEMKSGKHTIATPCVLSAKAGAQIVTTTFSNGMVALDAKTGKRAWEMPGLFSLRCVSSPIVTDAGLIVGQCGEGSANSLVEVVKPGEKPEKVYEVIRTGGYVPTPIAVGDLLFLWKENGFVTCLRAATNEQLWSERVEGPYYASPICVGGKGGRLYNLTRSGELVVIAADEKFKLIQRFPLGERNSFATPAVSGGKLYVRTFTQLIAIGK